jgi:hypothetical protein
MELLPAGTDLSMAKSFWQRREGKTGIVFALIAIAVGVKVAILVLPMLILLMQDVIMASVLGAILFAMFCVVFNKTFQAVVRNMFQLSMRWLTNLAVEVDPIGICMNKIDNSRKELLVLAKAVESARGASEGVEQAIQTNSGKIRKDTAMADQALAAMKSESNPIQRQRFELTRETKLEEIGTLLESNKDLQSVATMAKDMYEKLSQIHDLAEFDIERSVSKLGILKSKRETILIAFKALAPAKRILQGDPEELRLVTAAVDFIERDNANKKGAILEFSRWSEKYVTDMTLTRKANAAEAQQMIDSMRQKLLPPANETLPMAMPGSNATLVPVTVNQTAADYDYFNK